MSSTTTKTGLSALVFKREETLHPIFKKIVAALEQERERMRAELEHPANIESTTLLRGELRAVKRILARTSEVGPESRQSEADGPESAPLARAATGFPVSFDQ
jgi:hypothetical protein